MTATGRRAMVRVAFQLSDEEFARMIARARAEDVHTGGVYDLRGAIVTVWEQPWADVNSWKYLSTVGEIHYQHPSSIEPPTIRRLVPGPRHDVEDLLPHLSRLTGRSRQEFKLTVSG